MLVAPPAIALAQAPAVYFLNSILRVNRATTNLTLTGRVTARFRARLERLAFMPEGKSEFDFFVLCLIRIFAGAFFYRHARS
jgi:hypothetical protein